MNHVFVDRGNGGLRLYIGGELQFDAADERLYHEPLAQVPVALARRRHPGRALRALILGGGDGLALREVLRTRDVVEAHVVDHDPVVLGVARTDLASVNAHAFEDRRVTVHVRDAVEFLLTARAFDVLIADFTYPRDVAGARLHSTGVYERMRAALAPDGVVAVNAVSPEQTPEAFGCMAATLGVVGLSARPYSFRLPSFAAEGYGRWGFLFASARPTEDDEVGALTFPDGTGLTAADVLKGGDVPRAAAVAMQVAPNGSDELLYQIENAVPVAWEPPFERLRFGAASATPGPRLTVGEGFARWVRQPDGQRSLETLLACVPLAQRGPARAWLYEWSHHAEVMFREVDLHAFAERALRRAATLPAAWQRELRELTGRLRHGLPSMRELFQATWRVFAVFLLALLLANILFPDNLYAKGFGSGRSSSTSGPSQSSGDSTMHFSNPAPRVAPFRYRSYGNVPGGGRGFHVSDPRGTAFQAPPFVFAEAGDGRRPVRPLLALTRELRLLDGGGLAYFAPVMGHQFVLHPDRLDVVTNHGEHLIALHPGALADEAASALAAQAPLVTRAMDDHRKWVAWARWGRALAPGRDARSEMEELERIQRAFDRARVQWSAPRRAPRLDQWPEWRPLMPGVFLAGSAAPELILVDSESMPRRRTLDPPRTLTDMDRFVFSVLEWGIAGMKEQRLAPIVHRWRLTYGPMLDPPAATTR